MREEAVVAARDELVFHDLVAFQAPLTQVLSLPKSELERSPSAAWRRPSRRSSYPDSARSERGQS
jgi:hypothetical protein